MPNWKPEVKIICFTCVWCPAFVLAGCPGFFQTPWPLYICSPRLSWWSWPPVLNLGLQPLSSLTSVSLSHVFIPIAPPTLAPFLLIIMAPLERHHLVMPLHVAQGPLSYFISPPGLATFFCLIILWYKGIFLPWTPVTLYLFLSCWTHHSLLCSVVCYGHLCLFLHIVNCADWASFIAFSPHSQPSTCMVGSQ